MTPTGQLFLVATPIGNLADITERARHVLGEVDLIAAEDTRHSKRLLNHLGIDTPLVSLHEHNEEQRSVELIQRMGGGESIALISDAGTPLVSDPGYRLVNAAIESDIVVIPVPGPSSVLAALSVSGLPSDRFQFEGFLPAKAAARRKRLTALADLPHSLICFESPRRLAGCFADIAEVMGEQRRCVIARELTKLHETVWRGSAGELLGRLAGDEDMTRGEAVLVIDAAPKAEGSRVELSVTELLGVLREALPPGQAASVAAKLTGKSRRELYRADGDESPGSVE